MNKAMLVFGLFGLTLTVLYLIAVVGPAIHNVGVAQQNVAIATQERDELRAELDSNMADMGITVDEITGGST